MNPARLLLPLLCVLAVVACKGEAQPTADPGRTGRAPLEFEDLSSGELWKLEPRPDYGYYIRDADGAKVGKIKVQADRVKVKDASDQERAKAKRKDDGFKLYDRSDRVTVRGKNKGEKLKLTDDTGGELGKIKDGALRLGSTKLKAKPKGGGLQIERDGSDLFAVRGDVTPEAAAVFGWKELDVYQRLALVVFLREVY